MKKKMTTRDFVRIGMLTALACILTMIPQIPTGTGGYVHFGDSIIYVTAAFLGPAAVSLIIVTLGYFIAEIPMFGIETAAIVFISSPVQWLMSVAASAVFIPLLNKYKSKIGL